MRRKIRKNEAKRYTAPARWAEFETWVKGHPGRLASFYTDGGLVYAEVGGGVACISFHLAGQGVL